LEQCSLKTFRRLTNGLIRLERIRNFSTTNPTYYSPAGKGDLPDIVVHQNIRVSDVIVSDILDSDHLPVIFHILDHIKIRNIREPIEKYRDWDRFQSLASELKSTKIEINSGIEANKAARDFTDSIA
jgi:hypothetical protein